MSLKEKIKDIIYVNGKVTSKRMISIYFEKYYIEIYNIIISKYDKFNLLFSAILYMILNDMEAPPTCIICGKQTNFQKFSKGFSTYCSHKCMSKDKNIQKKRENTTFKKFGFKYVFESKEKRDEIKHNNLKKYGVEHTLQNKEIQEKRKQTNLKKYGVENPIQTKELREKTKQTNLKKYGVENAMQNKEIREKTKQTNLKKYGVNSPAQNEEVQEKTKQTNLKRYGTEYTFQNEEIKEKIKQTNLERYDVKNPMQNKEIQDKLRQTNLKRYGTEYGFQNEEIREKSKQTILKKYGVENVSESKIILEKICNTKLEKYGDKYYHNIEQMKLTNIERYGKEFTLQSKEIQEKINQINQIKYINKHATLLNISLNDILISGNTLTILNYCKKHQKIQITKSLLYSRLFCSNLENICTECNPPSKTISIQENELFNYCSTLSNNIIRNNTSILKNKKEIDIYFFENKLGIEFNGLRWHCELFRDKYYHLNKTNECINKNIELFHIFEDEWHYKKDIIKSLIKNKLNIYDQIIDVNLCDIKEVDNEIAIKFINDNNIFGYDKEIIINIGLFYHDELVSIIGFNKEGFDSNLNIKYGISRFANKLNINIDNSLYKLIDFFIKKYNPHTIITYVDKRFFYDNTYENLGFIKIMEYKPKYYYVELNKKIGRKNKNLFIKSNIINCDWYDFNKTFKENLLIKNTFKIYDCGKIKYQLDLD